jgi:hypothetical protein
LLGRGDGIGRPGGVDDGDRVDRDITGGVRNDVALPE